MLGWGEVLRKCSVAISPGKDPREQQMAAAFAGNLSPLLGVVREGVGLPVPRTTLA
jgi:hypothetical protein